MNKDNEGFQILLAVTATLLTILGGIAMASGDYEWGIFLALLAIKAQLQSMAFK